MFLRDIEHHHLLAGRRVEVVELWQDGAGRMAGVLILKGPFGLNRRVATREILRESTNLIVGLAATDSRSVAMVSWVLTPVGADRTRISLSAKIIEMSGPDRLLLMIGGQRTLAGILSDTLCRLESHLASSLASA